MSTLLSPSLEIQPDVATTGVERPSNPPLDSGSDRFVLFPARAFLAFGWLRAGVEKVIDGSWWSGAEVDAFLSEQSDAMLPFMEPLAAALVAPAPFVTAAIVLGVELVLGVLLLTGRKLAPALLGASALNVIFVLMGVVTPSAFYLVIQLTLLLALCARTGWFTARRRVGVIGAIAFAASALTPFIATVHPAEVIHDPAIMLVTVGALAAATQAFTLFATSGLPGRWWAQTRD